MGGGFVKLCVKIFHFLNDDIFNNIKIAHDLTAKQVKDHYRTP